MGQLLGEGWQATGPRGGWCGHAVGDWTERLTQRDCGRRRHNDGPRDALWRSSPPPSQKSPGQGRAGQGKAGKGSVFRMRQADDECHAAHDHHPPAVFRSKRGGRLGRAWHKERARVPDETVRDASASWTVTATVPVSSICLFASLSPARRHGSPACAGLAAILRLCPCRPPIRVRRPPTRAAGAAPAKPPPPALAPQALQSARPTCSASVFPLRSTRRNRQRLQREQADALIVLQPATTTLVNPVRTPLPFLASPPARARRFPPSVCPLPSFPPPLPTHYPPLPTTTATSVTRLPLVHPTRLPHFPPSIAHTR